MIRASRIIVVMTVLLMVLPGMVLGYDSKRTRETLRGIDGISVVVEVIEPEIEKAGLTQRQIIKNVGLQFFLTRLKVFTPETGGAVLYVRPFVLKHQKLSSHLKVDMYHILRNTCTTNNRKNRKSS